MLSQAHLMTVAPQFAGTNASSGGSGLELLTLIISNPTHLLGELIYCVCLRVLRWTDLKKNNLQSTAIKPQEIKVENDFRVHLFLAPLSRMEN